MADATTTDLIGKLFGSGWPVALMLLAFMSMHYKMLVPGWALSDRDKTIAEKAAEIEKLKAEHSLVLAFWVKRADDSSAQLAGIVKSLDRAVDGFEAAEALVRRVAP